VEQMVDAKRTDCGRLGWKDDGGPGKANDKYIQSPIFCAMQFRLSAFIPNVFAMSKDEVVDSRVSLNQVRKAVEALHSHELKKKEKFEENQLLPAKEQNLWLNVTVKAIPSNHKLKPVKMYAFFLIKNLFNC